MKRLLKQKISKSILPTLFCLIIAFCTIGISMPVYAGTLCGAGNPPGTTPPFAVKTSIDLGCQNQGNPILDLTFGIIRFLSAGVGVVVVASVIIAGIQFATARSDPQQAAAAIGRVRSSLIALLIFIFAYAILSFVIPGKFFL